MNRRKFLQLMGVAGVAAAVPWKFNLQRMKLESARAFAFAQSPILQKFIQPLPGLTAANQNPQTGQYLTVMTPDTTTFPGSDYYRLVAGEYQQKVHPSLPPTTFIGYADASGLPGSDPNHKYLGGVIVAQKNRPVRLTVRNNLPLNTNLSGIPVIAKSVQVDQTLPMWNGYVYDNGNGPKAVSGWNRISTHLHGGFPPWFSDGTPFSDFDPQGGYGASAMFPPDMPAPPPGSYNYYWTNQQTARFMWYHDHAMHITRLNAYAGLATGYVLTDSVEANLLTYNLLPKPQYTVYMVLQDKTFNADGTLWYPYQYEWAGTAGRWAWAGDPNLVPPVPHPNNPTDPMTLPVSLIPEAFLDSTIINGAIYPFLEVEPRHYRFRILNGAQARFYNLQIYYAQSNSLSNPLSGEADLGKPGPQIVQVGTEGGFLQAPVLMPAAPAAPGVTQQQIVFDTNPLSPTFGNATNYTLLLAPAERCDIIVDFSKVPVGSKLILYSDAPAPFPGGDPRNDYFTGDPNYTAANLNPDNLSGGAPTTQAGFGPNTRTLMQFRVISLKGAADSTKLNSAQLYAQNNAKNAIFPPIAPLPTTGTPTRRLTLNETFDYTGLPGLGAMNYGRLVQLLGTNVVQGVDVYGVPMFYQTYEQDRGQVVKPGTTEIWEIINLTGDTHPIHFHLVNVQVLNRQVFDDAAYSAAGAAAAPGTAIDPTGFLIGAPRPPDKNETGYKETVRMNPHEITRVIMRFDLPQLPWPVPLSTRHVDVMDNTTPRINGYEYVWHCHILEHEEHDMMHLLTVEPAA